MDGSMQMQPALLLPEITTFIGGLIVLLGGSFLPLNLSACRQSSRPASVSPPPQSERA